MRGDSDFNNGGREDKPVRNLRRVHDGKAPSTIGDDDKKHNIELSVDSGSATKRFGKVNSKLMKLLITGGGSEENTSWESNLLSKVVATAGCKKGSREGRVKAIVVSKLTNVIG